MAQIQTVPQKTHDCTLCMEYLPFPNKLILRAHPKVKIFLIAQVPCLGVQESGIPWQEASGERLRDWMGIDSATFDDEEKR
ncbi:hypothetical protein [Leptospira stimsonii]|uniref:Uracil-DNA glycosylase n=1 Tax=Leptospira stimsonii TaxID=2202203 RepID=A0A8B3CHW6_9LEPT|nr:hypothetical protein [Leptospira stimsonii]RHX83350.1 hypothetical protein DLM78_21855 [Leptospira stimsonii]